jgi:CubicO group peptidase (beta-lactamase class C family)
MAALPTASPEDVGLSSGALTAALDAYAAAAEREGMPGGVLVVSRGSECCFLRSFGVADVASGKPLQTDAIFRAASMTKITTSIAIMMLYDRGLLLLDDPVSKWIPAFARMERVTGGGDVATMTTAPCATQMTVRHLLTHTAGITYGFYDGAGSCGVVDECARDRNYTVGATDGSGDATGENLAAFPLAFEPGSKFRYSSGTSLLGRIVTLVSGRDLDAFVREELFQPLGMVDTDYFVPAAQQHRLVTNYTRIGDDPDEMIGVMPGVPWGVWKHGADKRLFAFPDGAQGAPAEPPQHIMADGGLYTTASDWHRFMACLQRRGITVAERSPRISLSLHSNSFVPRQAWVRATP